jgi:predicted heme/steroid binding protein
MMGWYAASQADEADLPQLSWEELGRHNSREDCWVAIGGVVYDLSDFLAVHPGGEALVLDAAAGGDASEVFQAIHDPTVLSKWGGTVVPKIGRVSGDPPRRNERTPWGGWKPVPAQERAYQGLTAARAADVIAQNPHLQLQSVHTLDHAALQRLLAQLQLPIDGDRASLLLRLERHNLSAQPSNSLLPFDLESPFPHGQFETEQLEAVRFQWADYSRLTEPQSGDQESFSQKSKLHVLNVERDWLDCDVKKYASEMSMRHTILTSEEYSDAVYVGQGVGSEAHAAEVEVLDEMLAWLPKRYPDRFRVHRQVDGSVLSVQTLTPGYLHTFNIADFAETPLKLAALLVQEEFYLMIESDADPNDEQHPSGRKHTLQAGVSIFAFDIHEKADMAMSEIHNANVPGWKLQLQQNMNHVFANMEPDIAWLRHNWLFQDYEEVLHPCKRRGFLPDG